MAATTAAVVSAAAGVGSAVNQSRQGRRAVSAQKEQNAANLAYSERMAEQARNDATALQPGADRARNAGYQAALEALGGGMRQQIDTTARGNYRAQQQLLAGLPQIQNAILGIPVNTSAMQAQMLHPERNLSGNYANLLAPQLPGAVTDPLQGKTAEDAIAAANALDFKPGTTTNRELVAMAYQNGLIDQGDYNNFQRNFAESNTGSNLDWASADSASDLIGRLDQQGQLHPNWRLALENFFTQVYNRRPQG